MELSKVCRLCGKEAGEISYNIFEKNGNGKQIIQLIKQFIPIIVYRTDPLSKQVCEICYKNLNKYSEFLQQCIHTQESFQNNLAAVPHNNVQLYFNVIEHSEIDFLANLSTAYKKIQMDFTYQAEPIENDGETNDISNIFKRKNVKILTPELINRMNPESNFIATSITNEGPPLKKRRLAGPKSKTQRPVIKSPLSLLQCALQQINKDFGLDETMNGYETTNNEDLSFDIVDIDVTVPVVCNYCMKEFDNILELAKHEKIHILVDIGPRVENRKFATRCRQYYNLYLNWRKRMEMEMYASYETFDNEVCNESSLLIPTPSTDDKSESAVFEVVDNQITVNGVPLKDYDKAERRTLYKSVIVDGVKRKFCPICRHTFKDNWAIDIHYINSSCQYTCKFCGLKFKFHKDLYPEHLKTHAGEPCTKIFGPTDKKAKFKKRKIFRMNHHGGYTHTSSVPRARIRSHMQKKVLQKLRLKTEPGTSGAQPSEHSDSAIQPYQAYFCRKCFKVFFKIDEFNSHTNVCKGTNASNERERVPSENSKSTESSEIDTLVNRRPIRSCVKDIALADSDTDSLPGNCSPIITERDGAAAGGFECGICCSSFPSRQSRNSHMRIHKGQKISADKLTNFISTPKNPIGPFKIKAPMIEPVQKSSVPLATLNPTVARLVQNNPHLTIRSYKKSDPNSQSRAESDTSSEHSGKNIPVGGYRCGDCNMRCPNKSLLYYHKMNDCVVKRDYECGFCRKKFGGQEQYNMHMLYVHPE